MKKNLSALFTVLVLTSIVLSACAPTAPATPAAPAATPVPVTQAPAATPMKIAFFVSDLSNVFHQAQATEAKKYAKEKYGVEVFVFDGKSDGTVMTQNVDQIAAQGMDAASLHIWDYEAVKPAVQEDLGKGIILTSFFSPLGDSGIPVARSDEKGISFAMGAEMAKQWKAAHPDKPIVMVELGWPNHTEVKSGRTDPFVKGVLSVDPKATDLGCQDASKGPDAAKQIITDLMTTHPEINLIYSEASNLTVGTMAALAQAGRGAEVEARLKADRKTNGGGTIKAVLVAQIDTASGVVARRRASVPLPTPTWVPSPPTRIRRGVHRDADRRAGDGRCWNLLCVSLDSCSSRVPGTRTTA